MPTKILMLFNLIGSIVLKLIDPSLNSNWNISKEHKKTRITLGILVLIIVLITIMYFTILRFV